MGTVIALQPKKHIYELEQCAGCGKTIKEHYTELGLPSGDNRAVTHIALCNGCYKQYLEQSAVNVPKRKSNVQKIVELIKQGKSDEEIATQLNQPIERVKSIRNNKKIFK